MLLLKIIKHKKGNIVSLCDKEVLGKIYKDETYCLDLIRYRDFYEGKEISEYKNISKILKDALVINAVGFESIKLLEKYGFGIKNVKRIGKEKIEHLQIYKL